METVGKKGEHYRFRLSFFPLEEKIVCMGLLYEKNTLWIHLLEPYQIGEGTKSSLETIERTSMKKSMNISLWIHRIRQKHKSNSGHPDTLKKKAGEKV